MFKDYDDLHPENVLKELERTGRVDAIESDLVKYMIARHISVTLFDLGIAESKNGEYYVLTEAILDSTVDYMQEQLAKYGE